VPAKTCFLILSSRCKVCALAKTYFYALLPLSQSVLSGCASLLLCAFVFLDAEASSQVGHVSLLLCA
jgi:hypothetical protein